MCPDRRPARGSGDDGRECDGRVESDQVEPASEDHQHGLENSLGEPPVWSYCQTGPRGTSRTYTGHVVPVGGADGERLRRALAAIARDLLEWASRRDTYPSEGGEGDGSAQTG
jgi:hypothetical protein